MIIYMMTSLWHDHLHDYIIVIWSSTWWYHCDMITYMMTPLWYDHLHDDIVTWSSTWWHHCDMIIHMTSLWHDHLHDSIIVTWSPIWWYHCDIIIYMMTLCCVICTCRGYLSYNVDFRNFLFHVCKMSGIYSKNNTELWIYLTFMIWCFSKYFESILNLWFHSCQFGKDVTLPGKWSFTSGK